MANLTRCVAAALIAAVAATGCGTQTVGAPAHEIVDEVQLRCVDATEEIHAEVTDVEAGLAGPRQGAVDPYMHVRAHLEVARSLAATLAATHPDGDVTTNATQLLDELGELEGNLDDVTAAIGGAPTTAPGDTPTPGQQSRGTLIDAAVRDARDALEATYAACPGFRGAR